MVALSIFFVFFNNKQRNLTILKYIIITQNGVLTPFFHAFLPILRFLFYKIYISFDIYLKKLNGIQPLNCTTTKRK